RRHRPRVLARPDSRLGVHGNQSTSAPPPREPRTPPTAPPPAPAPLPPLGRRHGIRRRPRQVVDHHLGPPDLQQRLPRVHTTPARRVLVHAPQERQPALVRVLPRIERLQRPAPPDPGAAL